MTFLQILWFILVFVLICGYFVLDGFDLGIGVLYPFLGKGGERDKALMRRAVGPVWDGNEVWLLTAGGALFAAFPPAYATSFSGFYLAIMLVLFGLIIRAVSIEFRGNDAAHKGFWDVLFFIGSLLPALLYGVAIGNILVGIPLDGNGDYMGSFFALLNPFSLLCGVLGLAQMIKQGASWLAVKLDEGEALYVRAVRVRDIMQYVVILLFVLASIMMLVVVKPTYLQPGVPAVLRIVFIALFVAAFIAEVVSAKRNKAFASFISTSVICFALVGLAATTLFPNIIPATRGASITVASAASSETALLAMTIITCIGLPLVLVYHVLVYRTFRGKLKDEDLTY